MRIKVTQVKFNKVHSLKDKGLSTADLCKLTDLSPATINRIKSVDTLQAYKDLVTATAGVPMIAVKSVEETKTPILGYKAFDQDWKCRGMQYEVGKTFGHNGVVSLCNSGLHFVENPMDIFNYYPPTSKFAQIEAYGVSDKTSGDSKRAAKRLDIKAELSLQSLVTAGVKFILSKVDFENAKESNTGYQSAATNTGARSAATNTGNQSAATNTGYQSAATIEGEDGVAIVTGYEGKASGKKSCWIVLTDRDCISGKIKEVRAVEVEGKKIKEDTFYMLKDGKVVEA